jgi:hypothetical protein
MSSELDPQLRLQISRYLPKLRRLLADTTYIMENGAPDPDALRSAPVLMNYRFGFRDEVCLIGKAFGHPRLGDNEIFTSQLFLVSRSAGWARTFSRFYWLAEEAREGEGTVSNHSTLLSKLAGGSNDN